MDGLLCCEYIMAPDSTESSNCLGSHLFHKTSDDSVLRRSGTTIVWSEQYCRKDGVLNDKALGKRM